MGQRRAGRMGDGLEFADRRAYAAGDDIRFVDWACYARMERLLLRLFHEQSHGQLTILLDGSASMDLGSCNKFDYARRTAAAMAYLGMANLDGVRILPFAGGLQRGYTAGRNHQQMPAVLEFLEGLSSGGKTDLSAAVAACLPTLPARGWVLLCSDLLDVQEELDDCLRALRSRGQDVSVLHVVDAQDADPAVRGPCQVVAVEAGGHVNAQVTPELLEAYRQQWRRFCEALEAICRGRGASYLPGATQMGWESLARRLAAGEGR